MTGVICENIVCNNLNAPIGRVCNFVIDSGYLCDYINYGVPTPLFTLSVTFDLDNPEQYFSDLLGDESEEGEIIFNFWTSGLDGYEEYSAEIQQRCKSSILKLIFPRLELLDNSFFEHIADPGLGLKIIDMYVNEDQDEEMQRIEFNFACISSSAPYDLMEFFPQQLVQGLWEGPMAFDDTNGQVEPSGIEWEPGWAIYSAEFAIVSEKLSV